MYREQRKKPQKAGDDFPHMDTCQVRSGGGGGCSALFAP
jgi:hypothetical protein